MPLYSIGDRRVALHGTHHYVAPDASIIGSVTLENEVSVWFNVVIRADNDQVFIVTRLPRAGLDPLLAIDAK